MASCPSSRNDIFVVAFLQAFMTWPSASLAELAFSLQPSNSIRFCFRMRLYDYNSGGFSQHILLALIQYVFVLSNPTFEHFPNLYIHCSLFTVRQKIARDSCKPTFVPDNVCHSRPLVFQFSAHLLPLFDHWVKSSTPHHTLASGQSGRWPWGSRSRYLSVHLTCHSRTPALFVV